MPDQIQKITIKALICKEDSFLLVKDQKGVWEMPGGKMRFGETLEQTLKRELREELGLTAIEIKEVVDVWTFSLPATKDYGEYQIIGIVYEVVAAEKDLKKIKISDEHQQFKWVPFDEIADLEMREVYKKAISKFLEKK